MNPTTRHDPDFLSGFFVKHPLFRSRSIGETIRGCTHALGSHRMRMQTAGRELRSAFSGIVCDSFAIVRLCHGAPVTIEPQVTDDYILQHMLSGTGVLHDGKGDIRMRPGVVTVTSPGQETRVSMASDSVNMVVRLPRRKVEERLQDLMQQAIKRPVVFEPCMAPHGPTAASWTAVVQHVCDLYEILGGMRTGAHRIERTLAEYMIDLLLQVQPHSYSSWLEEERALPPAYLRKARDYIQENLSGHVSVAALARATGVSARTLQAGFKRCFGQTPMEYLREQRLQHVHRELIAAAPDTRVTDVFVKFGIHDFGRYARYYRKRFGALPSEHLKVRRPTSGTCAAANGRGGASAISPPEGKH
jgi:AraC-like DNA-binding protein